MVQTVDFDSTYCRFESCHSSQQTTKVVKRAEDCFTISAGKNNTFKEADFRNLILDIFEQNGVNP